MIVATQNIYYLNKMYKPKEPLPCVDMKMVNAWLISGAAIDTDKGVAKTTPTASVDAKADEKVDAQIDEMPKTETKPNGEKEKEEKKVAKVKTRSRK